MNKAQRRLRDLVVHGIVTDLLEMNIVWDGLIRSYYSPRYYFGWTDPIL